MYHIENSLIYFFYMFSFWLYRVILTDFYAHSLFSDFFVFYIKTFYTWFLTNLCTQLNSIEEGKTTNFINMIDQYDRKEKDFLVSLIALLVYHWPSVVSLLKIFPIWLPLMSDFCHWSCLSMCLILQKGKIDAYLQSFISSYHVSIRSIYEYTFCKNRNMVSIQEEK